MRDISVQENHSVNAVMSEMVGALNEHIGTVREVVYTVFTQIIHTLKKGNKKSGCMVYLGQGWQRIPPPAPSTILFCNNASCGVEMM
jgi:hypothetical protein